MTTGELIREYRKAKGLSIKQLAEATEDKEAGIKALTKMAIYYIEGGKRHPTEITIRRIAKALNVPPAIFFS